MNNQDRAKLKQLSQQTLDWALGARIAISIDDWEEAHDQAVESILAARRLTQLIKERAQ